MIGKERFEGIKRDASYREWADWVSPKLIKHGLTVIVAYDDDMERGLFMIEDGKRFVHPNARNLNRVLISSIVLPLNGLVGENQPYLEIYRNNFLNTDPEVRATSAAFALTHRLTLEQLANFPYQEFEPKSADQLKMIFNLNRSVFSSRDFDYTTWINGLGS